MKKIIILLAITSMYSSFSQTAIIKDIFVNNVAIPVGGSINFGTNSSIVVRFTSQFIKPNNLFIGQVQHSIKTYSGSGNSYPQIPVEFFTLVENNTGFTGTWEKTLYAEDYSFTGGNYLASRVEQTSGTGGNPPIIWNSNQVVINRSPIFSLNTTSLSLLCGDTSSRTFTVTSSSLPPGATLSYNWSYFGWDGAISNSNSITLNPTSGTFLPSNLSVTPIFNNIQLTPIVCSVTRASFISNAVITGSTGVCSGTANYTISNTSGQTVTWGLSNPSIASLNNQTNSGVTVNFSGNGAQTLSATITNQCNQTTVKPFQINTGLTTFSSPATLSGSTVAACSGSRVFTINNLPVGQNVSWSVSNPAVATLSGTSIAQATLTIIGSGSVNIIATITNNCGQTTTRTASLYGGTPTLTSFTCNPQGKPFCSQGQINEYTSNIPSLNLNDRVTAIFSGQTSAEANLNSNWQWRALNNKITLSGGTRNFRNVGCITFGITGLEVQARNACGWSPWYPLNWELVELPDPLRQSIISSTKIVVFPNPSSNTWVFKTSSEQFKTIELFDVYGKSIYKESFDSDEVSLNGSKFSMGIYFARVITTNSSETIKLIKN